MLRIISFTVAVLAIAIGQAGEVSISEGRLVPKLLNYQGYLTDTLERPINGPIDMTFRIFDAVTSGNMLWEESHTAVVPERGVFSIVLGETVSIPDSVFIDFTNIWLELSLGAQPPLTPRTRITSVGYAYASTYSDTAEYARNVAPDGDWNISGSNIYSAVSGNVGIGTSVPDTKLQVYDGDIKVSNGDIRIANSDHCIIFKGLGERIVGNASYDIDIQTGSSSSLIVKNSGSVGIGVTNPSYKLDVAGSCHASSFPTSSDRRLKKDVKHLTNVISRIKQINGVSFDWNETYEEMGRSTGHREIGVIAQEVEQVFPELVTTWGDEEYRGVDYGRLTAVLIEAVKEQQKQIEEGNIIIQSLQARIEALEGK